jgi:hypothetical protein
VTPLHEVLVTTSLRTGRRVEQRGEEVCGSLLHGVVDLEEGSFRLLQRLDLPPSPHRPSRRSVRGAAPFAGGIAVCNSTQLFLYDDRLEEVRAVWSERRLGDIHSIAVRDDILYITATSADSVLGVNPELEIVFEWWAGEEKELAPHMLDHHRERFLSDHDFRPLGRHRDRFHINHVGFDSRGDLIVNLPDLEVEAGTSKFWNVTRHRFHLAVGGELLGVHGRIHDGEIFGGHHYFGWTERGRFLKVCETTGAIVAAVDCGVPLGTTTGHPVAERHGWLRGAARLDDQLFLVGQSKLTLFLVDMEQETRSEPLRLIGVDGELDHPGLAVYCISKVV